MSRAYSPAEIREIIHLAIKSECGPVPPSAEISTDGARALFGQYRIGDLRHWSAFAEVFAFAYDPDTLEIRSVATNEDFFGDPVDNLVSQLDSGDGATIEVWGIRHAWCPVSADPGQPECLRVMGARPDPKKVDIRRVVDQAMEMRHPPAPTAFRR